MFALVYSSRIIRNILFMITIPYIILNVKLIRIENEEEAQTSNDGHLEGGSVSNSIDVWSHCIRGEGQIFKDAAEFRKCVKNYAVAMRRSFLYKKNDNQKVIVVCSIEECAWRIYASRHKADKIFAIRKCNLIHTCGDDNLRNRGHPKADAAWVSNVVIDRLRGEPSYRPCTMLKDIHREYGVELSYNRVWKGKELALHDIHGAEEGSYDRLRWYCSAIKETNPGSYVQCEIDDCGNKFKRLFICFKACAIGFINGCRPLVFLDGTHIKNKYKGCILVAVAKDANDDLFTLAYSVVDAENDDNWGWFCFQLRSALLSHSYIGFHEFTFFSDRHPGIIKAIQIIFPDSHHAYCLRHLVDNFVKQVMRRYPLHNKKYWSSIFKKAAYALSTQEFQEQVNKIVESMPLAKDFIISSCPESWANAYFLGNRWGVMNNNIAESWNNWVKAARYLPIVAMVDHIRIQIMDMMHRRREATMGMVKRLSPSKENALAKIYAESRSLTVRRACGWSFEVVDGNKSFAVDLSVKTCSCKAWQINRFPCKHSCAAIESKSLPLYDFCDKYYKIELYRESYKGILNPIPTCYMSEFNPENSIIISAPDVRSQPGRRRTQRIPSQVEKRVTKCGRCKRRGHNRRSCKEAIN